MIVVKCNNTCKTNTAVALALPPCYQCPAP
jgi:hypothetical protein